MGCLTCLVGGRSHQGCHIHSLNIADASHFVDFVNRNVGCDESVVERALHLNAQCFQFTQLAVVFKTDESGNENLAVDGIGCSNHTVAMLTIPSQIHIDGLQS